jgi:hypothetical protein
MNARSLIIAYALFRKHGASSDSNKYLVGMLANIEAISLHCPQTEVWIYYDESIGEEWLKLLKIAKQYSGLNIQLKSYHYADFQQVGTQGHLGLFGTLIRYVCLADFTDSMATRPAKQAIQDTILLIRDADMVMNLQDLVFIDQFYKKSGKTLHRYADSQHYPWPIIGGSFAIKPDFLKHAGFSSTTWRQKVIEFAQNEMRDNAKNPFCYFVDQRFLKEIYTEMKKKNKVSIIDTTEIHIPIAGQTLSSNRGYHYNVWWCDIADETPKFDYAKCSDLQKLLCAHSDLFKQWVKLANTATRQAISSSFLYNQQGTLFSTSTRSNKRKRTEELDTVPTQSPHSVVALRD